MRPSEEIGGNMTEQFVITLNFVLDTKLEEITQIFSVIFAQDLGKLVFHAFHDLWEIKISLHLLGNCKLSYRVLLIKV